MSTLAINPQELREVSLDEYKAASLLCAGNADVLIMILHVAVISNCPLVWAALAMCRLPDGNMFGNGQAIP
jgi:hypothetical protein